MARHELFLMGVKAVRDASPLQFAVMASGNGSTLQALIDACATQTWGQCVAVVVNTPGVKAIERARQAGIDCWCIDHRLYPNRWAFEQAVLARLSDYSIDYLVLAGFMRQLTPGFVEQWPGRLVNIHPSLLPKYPGLNTYARVLASGDTHHGSTVHYVTADLDAGPILAQSRLPILPADDPAALQARTQAVEQMMLPQLLSCLWSEPDKASLAQLMAAQCGHQFQPLALLPRVHGQSVHWVYRDDSLMHCSVVPRNQVTQTGLACYQAAATLGWGPDVLALNDRWLLLRWMEGSHPCAADYHDLTRWQQGLQQLRAMHQSMPVPEQPAVSIEALITQDGVGCLQPQALAWQQLWRRCCAKVREALQAVSGRAVCIHNDLHPGNIIFGEDGVRYIDWKQAGAGHPYWDVAQWALFQQPATDLSIVQAYEGRSLTACEQRAWLACVFATVFRCGTWALAQANAAPTRWDVSDYSPTASNLAELLLARLGRSRAGDDTVSAYSELSQVCWQTIEDLSLSFL